MKASEVGSTVIISNTIIAQNADMDCGGSFNTLFLRIPLPFYDDIFVPFPVNINGSFNLIGNNEGCRGFRITNDQVGSPDNPIDARLSELKDNGGPTLTHAPLQDSPSIDKGNPVEPGLVNNACAPIDQRVFLRPADGDGDGGSRCDLGAVEIGADRTRAADLAVVSKMDSPDPVTAGNNLTYTIRINNNGPDTATGVTLIDTLPQSVSFVSTTSPVCSESGGSVTCNLGTLASADTATIVMVVTPTTAGTITNSVSVSSNELDPYKSNNTDVEDTTISPSQCSDRLDNDGDRRTDFPADPGCSSPTDNSESPDPPTTGNIGASITVDVGSDRPRTCGSATFEVGGQSLSDEGTVISSLGPTGRVLYQCTYFANFIGLSRGTYSVFVPSQRACESAMVLAGRSTNVVLRPNRFNC